jgi:hypothetical protein
MDSKDAKKKHGTRSGLNAKNFKCFIQKPGV